MACARPQPGRCYPNLNHSWGRCFPYSSGEPLILLKPTSGPMAWPRCACNAMLGALFCALPALAFAQANGKLQIHQLNVGQGDAALIVSPLGQTMLIDTGPFSASSCASETGIIT